MNTDENGAESARNRLIWLGYAAGFCIMLTGLAWGGWLAAQSIYSVAAQSAADDGADAFLLPGEFTFTVEQPGGYLIYHEYESHFGGQRYRTMGETDELVVEIEGPGGESIEAERPNMTFTYQIFERRGASEWRFEAQEPGPYVIRAAYPDGREEPRAVHTIGRGMEGEAGAIARGLAIGVGGFLAGVIVILVTALLGSAGGRPVKPPPPPPPPGPA